MNISRRMCKYRFVLGTRHAGTKAVLILVDLCHTSRVRLRRLLYNTAPAASSYCSGNIGSLNRKLPAENIVTAEKLSPSRNSRQNTKTKHKNTSSIPFYMDTWRFCADAVPPCRPLTQIIDHNTIVQTNSFR